MDETPQEESNRSTEMLAYLIIGLLMLLGCVVLAVVLYVTTNPF